MSESPSKTARKGDAASTVASAPGKVMVAGGEKWGRGGGSSEGVRGWRVVGGRRGRPSELVMEARLVD